MRKSPTLFRRWAAAMGLTNKAAGELLGIGNARTTSMLATGNRDLTRQEQLAMSALRVGLPPWSPQADDELVELGKAREAEIKAEEDRKAISQQSNAA
ncbi:hypothetical protein H9Q09_00960 [Aurantimonas sp. DM33-3]|uniref:hypothetical protein n=1 Tax=Aurantimonas sp. DM33-3 TaxID=2766955 RepID=UPI0016520080|nr:hypothetical protein [Aurantimonas sp. DM33-3]MBC6714754.1 hypothetical protein [Aurantimonas sp. DM33-3]